MYIRSILLISMSLTLLNPLKSNPLNRFQKFIANSNNIPLVVLGTGYFISIAAVCTIVYKHNAKKHQPVSKKSKSDVENSTNSQFKQGRYGGSH